MRLTRGTGCGSPHHAGYGALAFVAERRLGREKLSDPGPVGAYEVARGVMYELSRAMYVAGRRLDVTVLDQRASLLRSDQPAAEPAVDDLRVTKSFKGLLRA